jgi:hypothetical protein
VIEEVIPSAIFFGAKPTTPYDCKAEWYTIAAIALGEI